MSKNIDLEIDLYADDSGLNTESEFNHDDNLDLYDDAISAPNDDPNGDERPPSRDVSASPRRHSGSKRAAVYVGNLTCWTSEKDLTEALQTLGVTDVLEIKFFENRINGQSKGFCSIFLASDASLDIVMEHFAQKEIHGKNPVVTSYTDKNLNYFENQSRKEGRHERGNTNKRRSYDRDRDHDREGPRGMPNESWRSRCNYPQPYPPPQHQLGRAPWMSVPPPQIYQMPPPQPGILGMPPPNVKGPLNPMGLTHLPQPDTRGPPPSHEWERPNLSQPPPHRPRPHINPAFLYRQGMPSGLVATSQSTDIYNRPPPVQFVDYRPSSDRQDSASSISEAEFEKTMGRNRTLSSSAIARAVADSSAGDYAKAIETLVTAISLIKQSKVADDERCKILIISLQDTLYDIESRSYGSRSKEQARSKEQKRSSRREKSSRRDHSRSRDRDCRQERDRHHEDRSRSRDREYRDCRQERDRPHEDRSQSRDREYRDCRQERDRLLEDRNHDRDRRSSRY